MSNEEEIAQFIVGRINAVKRISGPTLGTMVNAEFPDFRVRFGGLRGFVQKHCGTQIRAPMGFGKEDIYTSLSVPAAPVTNPQLHPSAHKSETPWKVFTIPESSGRIFADPVSIEIKFFPEDDDQILPAPWIEVRKVTTEENRQIARDFLPQISEPERGQFEQILETADFWARWFSQTRDFHLGKYAKAWAAFRFKNLCGIFLNRITELGIGAEVAEALLEKLKESKTAARNVGVHRATKKSDSLNSDISLRATVCAALECMSEDEIRRIWLPTGLIADALRRSQSQQ